MFHKHTYTKRWPFGGADKKKVKLKGMRSGQNAMCHVCMFNLFI
jgi:hypothetical protein